MRSGALPFVRPLTLAGCLLCVAPSASVAQAPQMITINVERLARLEHPWAAAYLPDGRLMITEKPGRLRIFAEGQLSEPIGGVPQVAYRKQGGLLDVKLDPDFARNQLVYLSYTEAADQQPADAREERDPRLGPGQELDDNLLKGGAVARGRLDGNQLRDVTVIWRQVPKTVGRGHFGGRLAFAPDGKLFITSGDRQRFDPAQDLRSNLGKVVRINPDGSMPDDNPFAGRDDARPDIWSLGHRNPLGAAFDTSGRLWINDMGPKGGDEFVIVEKGANHGWPLVSEGDHYDGAPIPRHATRSEFTAPLYSWNPSVSPAGLIFYTGELIRPLTGSALMGALTAQMIIGTTLSGDRVTAEDRIPLNRRIRDVIQAPDGALMVLSDGPNGELLRLTPAGETTGQRPRN